MRFAFYILFTILFFSCRDNNQSNTVSAGDSALHLINGSWYYQKDKPFTGTIKESFPDGNVKGLYRIENGKQQGYSETFHPSGALESKRWYTKGEKDSVHMGWWQNGNKKFEYHFTNGNYNGLFKEWYQSGKMLQEVVYDNGKEVSGRGWRESGKLYMSFVMKNGRRYGLFNANSCFSLSNETVK